MQTRKIIAATLLTGLMILGAGCAKKYEVTTTNGADQMIRNVNIKPGQKVTSPLKVTGEAKGGWYFEADFPIELQDANGKVLGIGIGQAQGEWMTENFVPFEDTFSFSPATTTEGKLILKRDNASGLPENDASYSIPVTF